MYFINNAWILQKYWKVRQKIFWTLFMLRVTTYTTDKWYFINIKDIIAWRDYIYISLQALDDQYFIKSTYYECQITIVRIHWALREEWF